MNQIPLLGLSDSLIRMVDHTSDSSFVLKDWMPIFAGKTKGKIGLRDEPDYKSGKQKMTPGRSDSTLPDAEKNLLRG